MLRNAEGGGCPKGLKLNIGPMAFDMHGRLNGGGAMAYDCQGHRAPEERVQNSEDVREEQQGREAAGSGAVLDRASPELCVGDGRWTDGTERVCLRHGEG